MKNSLIITTTAMVLCSSLLVAAKPAIAKDKGETLHNDSCIACHDTAIYKRNKRIVHNYEELAHRVQFCESMNQVGWSQSDKQLVTDYLNRAFYKFPKTKN